MKKELKEIKVGAFVKKFEPYCSRNDFDYFQHELAIKCAIIEAKTIINVLTKCYNYAPTDEIERQILLHNSILTGLKKRLHE